MVKTLLFLGGVSSGKSTLTKALAEKHGYALVPEYGRTFLEENKVVRFEDILEVAKKQIELEEAAKVTNEIVVCDTSPLTSIFFSYYLFFKADPALEELASREYTKVFMCDPNIPFQNSDERATEKMRINGDTFYREMLVKLGIPFIDVKGTVEERIKIVENAIADL